MICPKTGVMCINCGEGWCALRSIAESAAMETLRTEVADVIASLKEWQTKNNDLLIPHAWQTIERLERELAQMAAQKAEAEHNWRTWGVIEVAIRNPSVAEYMRHWEGRAESAERRVSELEAKLAESSRDAERLAYLTADHDDAEVRERRNDLLCRMPVMSHSAACADIDIGLAALAAERKEGKHG